MSFKIQCFLKLRKSPQTVCLIKRDVRFVTTNVFVSLFNDVFIEIQNPVLAFLKFIGNLSFIWIKPHTKKRIIFRNEDMKSKCGFTPYDGMVMRGAPKVVAAQGEIYNLDESYSFWIFSITIGLRQAFAEAFILIF